MQATVSFSGLVASFYSVGSLIMLFEFLDASFSSLGCFVFEFYVHHFQILRDTFFEFKVSFVFEFSVLLTNDLFLSTAYGVYSVDCALRQFVTVSGVVVSLRCFRSLLYSCQSSNENI